MQIKSITAREILASGGYPTVEAKVELSSGMVGIASVPYGASAGTHEASVLVDNDKGRYNGKGVLSVINNIETKIFPEIKDMDPENQREIDGKMKELDGTDNKSNLGGNAILAVSVAIAKAVANEKQVPLFRHIRQVYDIRGEIETLPNPMMVCIEGGKHAHDTTDMQEYCISGLGQESITDNIRKVLESYHALKDILKSENLSTNVGNEGAFAPNGIPNNEKPLEYLVRAMEKAGYEPKRELGISIDPAASEYFKEGKYHLDVEDKILSSDEMIAYFEEWFKKYPFVTVEDLLSEDDWEAWVKMTKITQEYSIPNIGDDLTVTNVERLQKAIDMKAITGILIKLNQIGSLTETVDACLLANQNNMITVPSHRGGGETNDAAMVDLAVAVGAAYIKVGPTRGERVAKYNRLMEIEKEIRG